MYTLSRWAHANPWISRIIIAACSFILIFIGIESGIWVFAEGRELSEWFLYSAVILLMSGAIYFPVKEHYPKNRVLYYRLTRIFSFLLIISSLMMAVFLGNKLPAVFAADTVGGTFSAQLTVLRKADVEVVKKKKGLKEVLHAKITKRVAKSLDKWKAKSPDGPDRSAQVIIGVLFLLLAFFSLYLVAALSCGIACSGSGALALAILLSGLVGVVILLSLSFRKLFPKMTKTKSLWVGVGVILGIFLLLLIPGFFN